MYNFSVQQFFLLLKFTKDFFCLFLSAPSSQRANLLVVLILLSIRGSCGIPLAGSQIIRKTDECQKTRYHKNEMFYIGVFK